ncbi:MAG: beta-galactosidase GalA [Thermomonas sp.]|uniref:beta-galactosidase GalA n=1 Tax=Thermomonas sp. TaxID=1971895 RepID=UPI0039E2682B
MTDASRRDLLRAMLAGSIRAALPMGTLAAGMHAGTALAAKAHASQASAAAGPRQRLLMDAGWRFHLGHAADPARDFNFGVYQRSYAKAGGDVADAAKLDFDDSSWRLLDLPHDWAVELPFVENPLAPVRGDDPAAAHGYRKLGREYPDTSVGWYRRVLEVDAADLGKRIVLEFGGAFRDCLVFCNGHIVAHNEGGYSGFEVDLSDVLDYGARNQLAIRVDASLGEGWFYEGAGLYRHVWLRKTDPLHVPAGGVAVRSELRDGRARAGILTELRNDGATPRRCVVVSTLFAPDGRRIARDAAPAIDIAPGELRIVERAIAIENPALWSPDAPQRYRLHTELQEDGVAIDDVETAFGLRTAVFDAQRGFLLNGKPLKLHGTCNHQDHAGVGAALPDALIDWRIVRLKSMGCNAYRSAHNPATPELLEACDRLGMLVIDETRRMGSDAESLDELERMIRRGRNHPCIVLWSLGNEEPQMATARGARIVASMQRLARRLDPTRPTTFAMDKGWDAPEGVGRVVDVVGFNYRTNQMDDFHARFPTVPVYGSETASAVSVRGHYLRDPASGYTSGYDGNYPWWASSSESWWAFVAERPWVAGGFIWTGFDYRGEPTPYNRWPNVASQFGVLDSCGFAKDNYWYYRAQWTDEPVLHLFPHWNGEALVGPDDNGMVDVWCHGNLDEVELFVNGVSQGRQPMPRHGHVEWRVRYAPGAIEAHGYRNGERLLVRRRETAGPAAAIVLRCDRASLQANAEDVAVVEVEIVDAQGRPVPTAANLIQFALSGPGRLIGVGNGDPRSHEPDQADRRHAFNGLCMALLQAGSQPGRLRLRASSPGLRDAVLEMPATPARLRPRVA